MKKAKVIQTAKQATKKEKSRPTSEEVKATERKKSCPMSVKVKATKKEKLEVKATAKREIKPRKKKSWETCATQDVPKFEFRGRTYPLGKVQRLKLANGEKTITLTQFQLVGYGMGFWQFVKDEDCDVNTYPSTWRCTVKSAASPLANETIKLFA